jgi:CTP:molybdopterin cytidylyltransferase MocA
VTVAAVIVPRDAGEALADAAGRAAARRIVDVAWAGGAMPLIVVVDDRDGAVAAALAGSPARVEPSSSVAGVSPYRAGADAATDAVVGTDGWLLWPGDHAWVDPETVTSLIEAHGPRPDALLRPVHAGRAGWPLLVPAGRLTEVDDALRAGGLAAVDALGVVTLDLGDPGSVVTLAVAIADVPAYVGPAAPVAGPPPDWGAAAADDPDWGTVVVDEPD